MLTNNVSNHIPFTAITLPPLTKSPSKRYEIPHLVMTQLYTLQQPSKAPKTISEILERRIHKIGSLSPRKVS